GSPKENPGFDCVIGNPPYVNVEGIPSDEREFLMQAGIYTTPIKRMDIFIPFHELSIKLLRHNGQHSFIVPFPLLTQDYGQQLRVFFLKNTIIKSIVNLSKYKIFPDAVVRNIIPVFEKKNYSLGLFN
ncbi:MAG: Eco57I restriction-modification methylase domain-containing protein, partial [Nanoarchaeota archaeon]